MDTPPCFCSYLVLRGRHHLFSNRETLDMSHLSDSPTVWSKKSLPLTLSIKRSHKPMVSHPMVSHAQQLSSELSRGLLLGKYSRVYYCSISIPRLNQAERKLSCSDDFFYIFTTLNTENTLQGQILHFQGQFIGFSFLWISV